LRLNQRGHDVAAVRRALGLLRTAGFKLHLHWMPNLYGATPDKDREDFARFFADPAIRPDELKIYPCSLIAGTELYDRYLAGDYQPYSEAELVALLADVKPTIPPYTRVNRLFRDIPAHHIQAGVKLSNLRQIVHDELARRGQRCGCIRCREIRLPHGGLPTQLDAARPQLRHRPDAGALSCTLSPMNAARSRA
jgi:elongator complex protein 3